MPADEALETLDLSSAELQKSIELSIGSLGLLWGLDLAVLGVGEEVVAETTGLST